VIETPRGIDVVVVGAGLSGLIATIDLRQAGIDAVCLEARDRVGGRTLSLTGSMDLGATWFWDGEDSIDTLTTDLNIPRFAQPSGGDAVVQRSDGSCVRVRGNPLDPPAHRIVGGVQRLAHSLAHQLSG